MERNILIVVEGRKTEANFFSRLFSVFGEKFDIYCLGTNIYSLYKAMKAIDFNGDIKDILSEIHPEQKDILSKKFAYTYLVFDCDVQHTKKVDDRNIKDIIFENFEKLKEMSLYFNNETDPSIGKLYINYPMMESYRDCNDFFDEEFAKAEVDLQEISNYKKLVASKKLHSLHIDKFSKNNFEMLILQNLYKLALIHKDIWEKPKYSDYLANADTNTTLKKEIQFAKETEKIKVLNTSLFAITDFYGNKNNFYDNLISIQ